MDYEKIKNLIDDMGSSKLTSLEIDFPDGMKIRMKKGNEESNNMPKEEQKHTELVKIEKIEPKDKESSENNENLVKKSENEEQFKYIKSPMVGTFYSKPSPDEDCFVEVGERISRGRTICIIEAMKLMNEIESEFDGEVVEILKKDGEPVEFGEILVKLK